MIQQAHQPWVRPAHQPMIRNTVSYSEEVSNALEVIAEDYEAFYCSLSEDEQKLTRVFCCSDTCDTIALIGREYYEFVDNGSAGWSVNYIGGENAFTVYVTQESWNFSSDEELFEYIANLKRELENTCEIIVGEWKGRSANNEWLLDNTCLQKAEQRALKMMTFSI